MDVAMLKARAILSRVTYRRRGAGFVGGEARRREAERIRKEHAPCLYDTYATRYTLAFFSVRRCRRGAATMPLKDGAAPRCR